MPYIVIENFNGGMDTRRMAASGTPGTLLELTNAHITRGGEIEKRKAYTAHATLSSTTTGLAADKDGLVSFGSAAAPAMPAGIRYQRLQHPSGFSLSRVLSWDLYAGKLFVAAEFSNGDIYHFYDGVRSEDWFDGKARGVIEVAATKVENGTRSQLNFTPEKDSEELNVRAYMTNEDNPDEPIDLTDGWVNIASGWDGPTWASNLAAAIDAESGTTGVEAFTLLGSVAVQSADATENLDGLKFWLNVQELGVYKASPTATPAVSMCTAEGTCTNSIKLNANASGGTAPYTYSWTIVDDGGAAAVSLDDATSATPRLTVTNATGGSDNGCARIAVTLKVEVTDDTAAVTEKTFAVVSRHCPPQAFGGGSEPIDRYVDELTRF